MQILRDIQAIQAMPAGELRGLIQQSAEQLLSQFEPGEYALEELGRYLVVEPGDDLAAIDEALGFAILGNRWDGTRWCDAGFTPSWETVEARPGWFELVYMQGQDGSGVTVFVSRNANTNHELSEMCQRYALAQ